MAEAINFKCKKCDADFSLEHGLLMSEAKGKTKELTNGKDWQDLSSEEKERAVEMLTGANKESLAKNYEEWVKKLMNHEKLCKGEIIFYGMSFID